MGPVGRPRAAFAVSLVVAVAIALGALGTVGGKALVRARTEAHREAVERRVRALPPPVGFTVLAPTDFTCLSEAQRCFFSPEPLIEVEPAMRRYLAGLHAHPLPPGPLPLPGTCDPMTVQRFCTLLYTLSGVMLSVEMGPRLIHDRPVDGNGTAVQLLVDSEPVP